MSYQSLAFFTGLFGSLHCVAMCGPLVMAVPFPGNVWISLFQKLIYQFARILTYSVLGFIAGTAGSLFNILGMQQMLSLLSGCLLIAIAIFHFSDKSSPKINKFYQQTFRPIAKFMGKWMSKPYGSLFAGALHGLIPCGMVYMAIAGSLNTGSSFEGLTFMFYFGLGTTPLLLLTSIIPVFFKKIKTPKLLIPILFLVSGSLLVSRALNLDIPYLSSPVIKNDQPAFCN